jgi:hypothetical protein
MFKLKNNRAVVVAFAVLMVLSVVAIYIPLLFPPQNQVPAEQPVGVSGLTVPTTTVVGVSTSSTATAATTTPNEKVTTPSTSTRSLPSSLQNLQSDENALNQIQNSLNK